jgi:hypothetical protein
LEGAETQQKGGYQELVAANESGLELKWKTSRQKTWHTEVEEMPTEQLMVGEALQLHIFISDCGSNYTLSAMLRASDRPVQEGSFGQSDRMFSIDVNQFYDTIRQSVREDTTLTVEIRKSESDQLIAKVDVLRFLERGDVS